MRGVDRGVDRVQIQAYTLKSLKSGHLSCRGKRKNVQDRKIPTADFNQTTVKERKRGGHAGSSGELSRDFLTGR